MDILIYLTMLYKTRCDHVGSATYPLILHIILLITYTYTRACARALPTLRSLYSYYNNCDIKIRTIFTYNNSCTSFTIKVISVRILLRILCVWCIIIVVIYLTANNQLPNQPYVSSYFFFLLL